MIFRSFQVNLATFNVLQTFWIVKSFLFFESFLVRKEEAVGNEHYWSQTVKMQMFYIEFRIHLIKKFEFNLISECDERHPVSLVDRLLARSPTLALPACKML